MFDSMHTVHQQTAQAAAALNALHELSQWQPVIIEAQQLALYCGFMCGLPSLS
jgi:hypothetical protein